MKTIFKYEIQVVGYQDVLLPQGAKILCVQTQHNKVYIWALVDEAATPVPRKIQGCVTGHTLPNGVGNYIGTVQLDGGEFVFHVFEDVPEVV